MDFEDNSAISRGCNIRIVPKTRQVIFLKILENWKVLLIHGRLVQKSFTQTSGYRQNIKNYTKKGTQGNCICHLL